MPGAQIKSFLCLHLHQSSQELSQAAHGDRLVDQAGVCPQPCSSHSCKHANQAPGLSPAGRQRGQAHARHTPAAVGAREQDGPCLLHDNHSSREHSRSLVCARPSQPTSKCCYCAGLGDPNLKQRDGIALAKDRAGRGPQRPDFSTTLLTTALPSSRSGYAGPGASCHLPGLCSR